MERRKGRHERQEGCEEGHLSLKHEELGQHSHSLEIQSKRPGYLKEKTTNESTNKGSKEHMKQIKHIMRFNKQELTRKQRQGLFALFHFTYTIETEIERERRKQADTHKGAHIYI